MSVRLMLVGALAGAVALAAGTAPALTADNGSVTATVSTESTAVPCLMLGFTAIDFGTLPFSDPSAPSSPFYDASPAVHFTACATAPEDVFLAASNATTSSGATWSVPGVWNTNICTLGQNVYVPRYGTTGNLGSGLLYNQPTVQLNFGDPLPPGQETDITFGLQMPCQGSVGAGEVATMTFSFLAVLA